jgi:hypothetical protein
MKLLILSALNAHHYGKTYLPDGSDRPSSKPTRWSVYQGEVNSLRDFSEIALKIEADHPNSTVVLGELTERGAEMVERGDTIYRRHSHSETHTNHLKDRAQHLLLLDVEYEDGLEHLDPQKRIEEHIKRLPKCFHEASYHAQLSSSYHIKSGLRVHLFFWSEDPIYCDAFRGYLERVRGDQGLVDHQPITASNAIIMSRPQFIGLKDYIEQRSIFVEKARPSVKLPSSAFKIEAAQVRHRNSYQSRGVVTEDRWARETLEDVCRSATCLGDGRNQQVYKDALRLGSLVGADRLSEYEVSTRLLEAYQINGLVKKRGWRHVEREIRKGINKGKLSPNTLQDSYSLLPSRSIRPKAQAQLIKPIQSRSSDEEITQSTAQLISATFKKSAAKVISVAESMTGAGKSGALINEAIKTYRDGGSVIYLARNHSLIEGEGGLLSRFRAEGIEPDVWRGKRRRCEELKSLNGNQAPEAQALLAEYEDLLVEHPIPQFCREIGCHRFKTDECSAWKEVERPIEHRLILAPQAYLSYLVEREEKGELPEELIIIIDERHDLIHSTPYEMDLISAFRIRSEDQKYAQDQASNVEMSENQDIEFRLNHPPVSRFALQLQETLNKLSSSIRSNQYGSRERLSSDMLLSINEELRESAEEAINYIERVKPKVKGLDLKKLRKTKAQKVLTGERIKRAGLRIITDLAQLITGRLDPLHTLHLFTESAGVKVERRVIQPLPKSVRIALADATPTEEILSDYVEALGFEMVITSSEINPHLVTGLHIQTKTLRQSKLFKDKTTLKKEAINSLKGLAHPISLMLRKLTDGEQVGLLCSKSLHDKIIKGLSGEDQLADHELIKELSRFQLVSGYYGRDERGSNEFEKCKALVVLGEAKPNLGSARADIEALTSKLQRGEDFDQQQRFHELYREQVDSATIQAFGRLRSVWNPDLIFIHVTEQTANLKGVRWSIYQALGRGFDEETVKVEKRAHQALDEGAQLTTKLLQYWGLTKDSVSRMINRISAIRPLQESKLPSTGGRPPNFWIDPTATPTKLNDDESLGLNRVSRNRSSSLEEEEVAEERVIDESLAQLKSNDDEDLGLNRVSRNRSSSLQLFKDPREQFPSADLSAPIYIYNKGLTRKSPKCIEQKDFRPKETLFDHSSSATFSSDIMGAYV